jgi:acetylornithine deacetylase
MDPIAYSKKLIRIQSLSGKEKPMYDELSSYFKKRGYKVFSIPTSPTRVNLFAYKQPPTVVLCSHMDTVPPYVSLKETPTTLYGRGACDTKSIIATQLTAAERLNNDRIGFLYVVGEEVDHCGVVDSERFLKKKLKGCKAIIVGEPTENKLATATKGIVKVKLNVKGKAAHSAYPALGVSAVHPLIEALARIQNLSFPVDRQLGKSTLNVGLIKGGVAANVFAPSASADILVRTTVKSERILKKIKKVCKKNIKLTVDSINDPIQLDTVPGFSTSIVSFNTDLPYMKGLSKKLFLLGPGSILHAHRPDERILKKEIVKGVRLYEKLISALV